MLLKAAASHRSRAELVSGLAQLTLICRGPKPAAALKPFGLRPTITIAEPNTWREVLSKLDSDWPVKDRRVAIQEYGVRNNELLRALTERGARVRSFKIYSCDLPEDTAPLKAAVLKLVRGQAHVAMFTSALQIQHLLRVAQEIGLATAVRRALNSEIVVASIGPITSEALAAHGVTPDIMPGHPKLGHLILAIARRARTLYGDKRERVLQSSASASAARIGK